MLIGRPASIPILCARLAELGSGQRVAVDRLAIRSSAFDPAVLRTAIRARLTRARILFAVVDVLAADERGAAGCMVSAAGDAEALRAAFAEIAGNVAA